MAVGLLVEVVAQLAGVDQVAVVCEADTVGGVDIERLALGALGGSKVVSSSKQISKPKKKKKKKRLTELVPAVGYRRCAMPM